MKIRAYKPEDCSSLAALFYDTVHSVNAKDYSEEQLQAWADGTADLQAWNHSFLQSFTVVAEQDGLITGFGNIHQTGYLDMLYVHKNHQRQGVAAAICEELENAASAQEITVHASITARPFFEKRGYRVVKKQQAERKGIQLTNYVMKK